LTIIETVGSQPDQHEEKPKSSVNLLPTAFAMLVIGVVWRIADIFVFNFGTTWMNILPSKLGPLLILLIVFWNQRENLLGLTKDNFRAHFLIGLCIGLSFFFVIESLGTILFAMFIDTSYPLDLNIINPELLLYAFGFFFVNAVYEEVLFRGVLQNSFRSKMSANQAILLSAIIFALWHIFWPLANGITIGGILLLVFTGVIGLFFGVYYEYFSSRRSLIGPIVAHTLLNFLNENFKIGPIPTPQGPDTMFPDPLMIPVMLVIFLIVFGIYFFFAFKSKVENFELRGANIRKRLFVTHLSDNESSKETEHLVSTKNK